MRLYKGTTADGSDAIEFGGLYVNPDNPNEWGTEPYSDKGIVVIGPGGTGVAERIAASIGGPVVVVEAAFKDAISSVDNGKHMDIIAFDELLPLPHPSNRRQRRAAKRGKDWRKVF